MIVISRNGKATVCRGWRAWLLFAAMLVVAWVFFALIAFVFVGAAVTTGIVFLLALPAIVVVAALGAIMRS